MKKFSIVLVASLLLLSCNKKFNDAMKSADKNLILQTANEYYAQKNWTNALALYERVTNLVAGTDDFPNVGFNTAYANYYQKSYRLAGHQFKNFAVSFPDDPRAEEASYMSALCYYEGSYDYNLDQTNTDLAINELQNFLNKYPNSERSKNINTLIDELMYKQEFKAYENARQYYKMGQYKAAVITFENVLEDFPSTKLRPKIYDFINKSNYELAMFSKYDLKAERLDKAIVLEGDAADEQLLIEENIENTDVFIALTNDDEANILSSMLAKRLGARRVMSLINRPSYIDLVESSIDLAISPQQITIGDLLAHIRRGDVVAVHSLRRGAAEALEIVVHGDNKTSRVVGRTLADIKLPPGTTLGAIVRGEETIPLNDATLIQANDHVIVFVTDKRYVPAVEKLFQVGIHYF